jgi:hypothetical protein
MAFSKLIFRPGLNRDQTRTAGEGGWYECDKVRFLSSFPEKIGGWVNVYLQPILGVCRQIFNYSTSRSDNLVFYGTNKKVYVDFGNALYDVTPLRATFSSPVTNNCFTVVGVGLSLLTVNINNHGANNGDYVTFSGVATFGGIPSNVLNNVTYEVTNATTNSFQINVGTAATSPAAFAGGTNIVAYFDIPIGPPITIQLIGWGAGTWGTGAWGTANPSIDSIALQRDWFFDNFDDDVVMNYRRGPIYYWTYQNNFTNNRAVLLSTLPNAANVPDNAMQTLVSQQDKHLLAFGCQPLGGLANDYDPLLIRWAAQDAPEYWTPGQSNIVPSTGLPSNAGFLRINGGTQIVRAFPTRQEILVWTEGALYSLKNTFAEDTFSLETLAPDISIMGVRAVAAINDVVYWMGKNRFYIYSGRVDILPCTLRNHIFQDFNYDQYDQVIAGTNELYGEIWWFYPTANSITNNAYVIYNYLEKIWYYGYLNRTAWLDSPLQQYPLAADPATQKIYYHENGCDADGLPIDAYILSSDIDLDDGNKLVLTRRVIPDVTFAGSTGANPRVYMSFKSRDFPGAAYNTTTGPAIIRTSTVPVEQFTNQVFMRTRARQIAFEIRSTDLGVKWQLGTPRFDGRPDGRR